MEQQTTAEGTNGGEDTAASLVKSLHALELGKRESSKEGRPYAKRHHTAKADPPQGDSPEGHHSSSILSRAALSSSAGSSGAKFWPVKEHYAVLGDLPALHRTTRATRILHEIRAKFVAEHQGRALARWYKQALEAYHGRIATEFPNEWGKDREMILVYGSQTAQDRGWIKADTGPHKFGFPDDAVPRYGQVDLKGLLDFLAHGAGGILQVEDVVVQYRDEFSKLQSNPFQPPGGKMAQFENFLVFCESNLKRVAEGEILAKQVIQTLHIVPSLEKQWTTLKSSIKDCPPAVVFYDLDHDPSEFGGLGSRHSSVTNSQASSGGEPMSFNQDRGGGTQPQNSNGEVDVQMALHEAAQRGDLSAGRHWLQRGADVNGSDHFGDTPMHKAIEDGHLDFVQWLMSEQADFTTTRHKDYCPPLHWAAWNGQVEIVQWMVEQTGASLHEADNAGDTPLHLACGSRRQDGLQVAKLLHSKGAVVDATNVQGNTPLHWAARGGDFSTVRWLVKKAGAHVHLADKESNTPLHWATRGGRHKLVRWLVQKGANLHATNKKGDTPLHWAAAAGHTNVVRWLIFEGAYWDVRNNEGSTALHMASENGHVEIVQWLVEVWFSVDASDVRGDTPLHIAIVGGHLHVAQCLLNRGANVQAKNRKGNTPLHTAAAQGNMELVRWFLEKQASLHLRNRSGETAADAARKEGHDHLYRYLKDKEEATLPR